MNTENNRLIAEFMGYPTYEMNGYMNVEFSEDNIRTIVDTHYHSDWNWLMEVVQKIEDLDFIFSIHHEVVNIFNGECSNLIFNETFVGDTKLGTTYLAAVEFIKWYNEQSN
jgi:hypothetical protein